MWRRRRLRRYAVWTRKVRADDDDVVVVEEEETKKKQQARKTP